MKLFFCLFFFRRQICFFVACLHDCIVTSVHDVMVITGPSPSPFRVEVHVLCYVCFPSNGTLFNLFCDHEVYFHTLDRSSIPT